MSNTPNDDYYRSLLCEIQQLRLTISDLAEQNRTLSAQNSELITKTQGYLHIEVQNRQLQNDIKDKEEKITQLERDKTEMQRNKIAEIREIELEHLREITYYKNQQENNIQKIETANIIIKLNEKQHKRILELEKEIEDMIKAENEQQRQNEIKHQNQFTNLKKKMMDHIKTAQKNMAQSNLDNLDLNTKLSKLTTNQLLIELEEQSTQIEELLKIKEKYEKEIFALKTDLNTHKKVEQVLQDKNKKYLDMVRKVDKKLELHKETLETNNNNNTHTHTQGNGVVNYTVPNYRNVNTTTTTTIAMAKRHYEKMYNKQNKEFHFLRDKYETFKEKHKMYEQKHAGVINLYSMAIDKLIQDDEIKKINDVNKIKHGEFNTLNKQEQYTVLTVLIKYLLPLINESVCCNGSSSSNGGNYESAVNVKDQFSTVLINQNLFNKNNITMTTFQEGSSNINNKNTMNRTTNSFNPKGKMFNSNSNNKTYTKFPKIEHLQLDSAKKRGHTPLYKILSIK